jgi:hypothetical protein
VVSFTKAFQRAATPALQVDLPSVTISNPDPAVREGARSLDRVAARCLLEAVAATWKVHWLREILPTT